MGIKGLFPFLSEAAPSGIKARKVSDFTNRTLAIDASTCLYQFIVAVRSESDGYANLTNSRGEITSHITGFLHRTLKLLEAGIKPVYVFDGAPPDLKASELRARGKRKAEAAEAEKVAREAGDAAASAAATAATAASEAEARLEAVRAESSALDQSAREASVAAAERHVETTRAAAAAAEQAAKEASREVEKAAHRSTKVTQQHNEDAKAVLRLMGVPVIEAPGEAEATCASLARSGLAYAAVTEDMDTLTFGAPVMVKNLFDTENARTGAAGSNAEKKPVYELHLAPILEQLGLSMAQFVDLCVLSGCDYLTHLPKVGPATAIRAVVAHGSIEGAARAKALPPAALEMIGSDAWPLDGARALFHEPEVARPAAAELAPAEPRYDELRSFLIERHSFGEARVDAALKRLRACRGAKTQTRIDQFFAARAPSDGASRKGAAGAAQKYDPFAKRAAGAGAAGAGKRKGPPAAAGGGKRGSPAKTSRK